jgi:hypothetical protein
MYIYTDGYASFERSSWALQRSRLYCPSSDTVPEIMGSVRYLTCGVKKFLSPHKAIMMTAAQETGISMALKHIPITILTRFISSTSALLLPSTTLPISWVSFTWLQRLLQSSLRVLPPIKTRRRVAGMQHAAAEMLEVSKVSLSGAGIT